MGARVPDISAVQPMSAEPEPSPAGWPAGPPVPSAAVFEPPPPAGHRISYKLHARVLRCPGFGPQQVDVVADSDLKTFKTRLCKHTRAATFQPSKAGLLSL